MRDANVFFSVCSHNSGSHAPATNDIITTKFSVLHPPVNAKQTSPTPDHTALHHKTNIVAKQHADVSRVSPLQGHPPLTATTASVAS